MKSIFDYPEIIKRLADVLFLNIEKYDNALYREFFVERAQDAEFLSSRLNEVQAYGGNVLVVGEPGIGKTNFLRWFLRESLFARTVSHDACTFLDLTTTPHPDSDWPGFIGNLQGELANAMANHLKRIGDPCHEIPDDDKTPLRQAARYNHYASKISTKTAWEGTEESQIHYLFLDDVDYLPPQCFVDVLEYLKPLLFSRQFCVIIACRTPAFNAIKSHRDYNVSRAFDDAKLLMIEPLPVHSVLQARIKTLVSRGRSLRLLLAAPPTTGNLKALFDYCRAILSALDPSEDIELFEYPFTEKQHSFMRMMTNGNLRHMLLMAQEYLHYMRNNRGEIKKEEMGYWVGRSAVIQHFSRGEIDAKIRVCNLHEKKTYQYMTPAALQKRGILPKCVGNSIAVVLLETYKEFQYPNRLDAQYIQKLSEEYGLSADDVKRGTADLIDYGLIRERVLSSRPALGAKSAPKDYDLTEKGECYLNYLIHWDEYIAKFGISQHHKDFRTREILRAMEAALVQFLVNILVVQRELLEKKAIDRLMIPKGTFKGQFCKLNRDLIRHCDPTDKLTIHKIEESDMTDYLGICLKIINPRNAAETKSYEFKPSDIEELAKQRNLPVAVSGVYDIPAFRRFVRTFVR